MANNNRWSLEQGIHKQAFGDWHTLVDLRRDPRAVLERALGRSIPEEIKVKVAFDRPNKIHQVVPFSGHDLLGSIEPPTGDAAIPGMRGLAVAAAHRAAHDPEFRAKLVADAKEFVKEGQHRFKLPADIEIVVLQEDARTIWLTVPLVGRPNLRKTRRSGPDRDRDGDRDRDRDRDGGRDRDRGRDGDRDRDRDRDRDGRSDRNPS